MKKLLRLTALLLAAALLTGCQPHRLVPSGSVRPVPEVPGEVQVPALTDPAGAYAAYGDFALDLLKAGYSRGEDLLLSPLSVALALGMTANGAGTETLTGFESLFHMDREAFNALCAAMLADYAALGGSTEATLVNSLWCDPDLTLEPLFTAQCRQIFSADLFHADLQAQDTTDRVNGWVKEATRGLIPSLVDQFGRDDVLALVNAVYLKNRFQSPFAEPTFFQTLRFTAADGTVTTPQAMHNGTRTEQYISGPKGRGVVLPYDDGRLGLLLMLPEEGTSLADYLAGWSGATIPGLLEARRSTRLDLTVPKFKVEWSGSLAGVLAGLGLADAFDPEKADFTAMGTVTDDRPLCIGDVIHKTVLDLNEKGTEAAAVTGVIMCGVTAVQEPPPELTFDRPFVYGIIDLENGAPLFLGVIETLPSAREP